MKIRVSGIICVQLTIRGYTVMQMMDIEWMKKVKDYWYCMVVE